MEVETLMTTVTEFVLLGLTQSPELKYLLFLVFFLVYLMTWLNNLTIIIVVITNSHLHIPLYFFLANWAFADNSDSSITAVELLWDLASHTRTISFNWCIIQIFLFHFSEGAGIFLLVVMAVDSVEPNHLHSKKCRDEKRYLEVNEQNIILQEKTTLVKTSLQLYHHLSDDAGSSWPYPPSSLWSSL
ncbi:hypothetical protein Y1Q_0007011 [Alligator mississippiensis]|uniref:G-protein coupled receptors family 1 profile domain-containing protein n=1 Tax=Alligator mississippiensis TaxID=8496 RepID=A0A151M645_ALLMI|nr:hypothetical protein Y1Q_0007011 [Alligator mississippiensis]